MFSIVNRSFTISSIPLLALFTTELAKGLFYLHIKAADYDTHFLFIIWIGLQVIFSIVTGIISDRFSRKYMLAIAAVAKLVAGWLCFQGFFLPAVCIDGIFGNLAPIARAAYCDVHMSQGKVPNVVNTFFMAPIAAIFFFVCGLLKIESIIALISCLLSAVLVVCIFEDFRDKKHSEVFVWRKLFNKDNCLIAVAFLLLNSQWASLYHQDAFNLSVVNLGPTFFALVGIAFLFGVALTRFFEFKPEKILIFVFIIISMLFFLDWLLSLLVKDCAEVAADMFLQFTLLGGVGQPLIYAFFGNRVTMHEQGAAYGLLESIQAFSELMAPVLLIFITTTYSFYMVILNSSVVSAILVLLALYKYQRPKPNSK